MMPGRHQKILKVKRILMLWFRLVKRG